VRRAQRSPSGGQSTRHTDTGIPARGKCLRYRFYFLDARFGLIYLRVPTWVPFRLQFYCNDHGGLACKPTETTAGTMIADAPPPAELPAQRPHRMSGVQDGRDGPRGDMTRRMRNFDLVYPQDDRKPAPPDVRKIALAFLLWRGNHGWKVVEVAPNPDGAIGFAI
jgi:hypothetical protein